jgi:hypothetical protein
MKCISWQVKLRLAKLVRGKKESEVSKKILVLSGMLALLVCACSSSKPETQANTNANANTAVASAPAPAPATTTRPGPDNSEITTTTDANGVKTETRVFKGKSRVSRVVVTTRPDGSKTVRAYSSDGKERELKGDEKTNALEATGDAVADSAGYVADKTVAGAKKGVEVSKDVGAKTADVAKTVGQKTAQTTKKVGEKTAEGAKKAGNAVKKVIP